MTREEQKDTIRSCQCRRCKYWTRDKHIVHSCNYSGIAGEARSSVAIRMGEELHDWRWCKLFEQRAQKGKKKSLPVDKTGQAQKENTQLHDTSVSEECQDPDAARRAKKAAQSREYYATHKDQHAEWAKRYRKQNRDRYNAYMREYYAKKALEQIRRELGC